MPLQIPRPQILLPAKNPQTLLMLHRAATSSSCTLIISCALQDSKQLLAAREADQDKCVTAICRILASEVPIKEKVHSLISHYNLEGCTTLHFVGSLCDHILSVYTKARRCCQ